MKNIKGIKGFKVFNSNWTCRNFQYKVGKTYKYYGDIGVCRAGFHFCKKLLIVLIIIALIVEIK